MGGVGHRIVIVLDRSRRGDRRSYGGPAVRDLAWWGFLIAAASWEGETLMVPRLVQDATADHAICTTGSLCGGDGWAGSFSTSSR